MREADLWNNLQGSCLTNRVSTQIHRHDVVVRTQGVVYTAYEPKPILRSVCILYEDHLARSNLRITWTYSGSRVVHLIQLTHAAQLSRASRQHYEKVY